jgi:hypothetical protein
MGSRGKSRLATLQRYVWKFLHIRTQQRKQQYKMVRKPRRSNEVIMNKQLYVFLLNNKGEGALVPRPSAFGYPPKITIGDNTFFRTDIMRGGIEPQDSMIYTTAGFKLNLDDFKGKGVGPKVHDTPVKYRVTVSYTETGHVDVEAKSAEEAEELAYEALKNGDIETDGEYREPDYKYDVEELDEAA